MPESTVTKSIDLVRYVLRESDLLRSPVFIFILVASGSRTALIFLINETAERGGATIWLIAALLGAATAMLAATHWSTMSSVVLVQRLILKMRMGVTDLLLRADVTFMQKRDHGVIYHTTTEQVNNIALVALRLANLAQACLLLVFVLGYMLLEMPASVIGTAIALAIGVAAFIANEGPASRANTENHKAIVAFHDSVRDLLWGFKEVRLREARRNALSDRVRKQVKSAHNLNLISERHYSYSNITGSGALAALLVSIVVVMPILTNADSVTLLQILTLVLFSFGPVEAVISGLPALARAVVSYGFYTELLDDLEKNAEQHAEAPSQSRDTFKSLDLRGATVHLTRDVGDNNAAKDRFTLGPIDLTLTPGQSVFITGGNGMGKSTLLQLLTGLRHPDEGEIWIDAERVTPATINSYRSVFSSVFSEFYMFRRLYGMTDKEISQLQGHIVELGLGEGITIKDGAFTDLALSTGQMRRLALAIALAEDRPIIVFDEFAADQDPARRSFFYDELVPRLSAAGKCVVAVTHDEHCFGKSDRLIKMEDGKIISDELQV